jgi:hypothetical protein
MTDDDEDKQRMNRLRKHYAAQQRTKNRQQRREEREAVRQAASNCKPKPIGTKRPALSAAQKKEKLLSQLDQTKLGDSFVISQIDDLFIGCSSCKSSVRHIMNRWNIDEDPDTLMVKIDRVATTVYKKQTAKQQMNMTVKEVAVIIVKHIEAFRQRNMITLESINEEREGIANRRTETLDAVSLGSVELAPAQRT